MEIPCIADFGPMLDGFELVGIDVGSRRELLALAVDRYEYRLPNGMARHQTTKPHTFKVLLSDYAQGSGFGFPSDSYLLTVIADERWNFHHIQRLPGGQLLLVCGRCSYLGDGKGERNGRIYSLEGNLIDEITLGDGVSHVQSDSLGRVWAGYSDEGVFGNCGWGDGRGSEPLGASGLVRWNLDGSQTFTYTPPSGALDRICDCYALNVVSGSEVWVYYYSSFPIVRVEPDLPREFWRVWQSPLGGSVGLAVLGDRVLLAGDYSDYARCSLVHLPERGGEAVLEQKISFIGEGGVDLSKASVVARGPYLYFLRNARVYRVGIEDVVR